MRFATSCSATKMLFERRKMPILQLIRFTGRAPDTKRRERENTMIAALVRFIQEWKRYNQSLSELSRLGDRELADIGISRCDIPRVAWNAAHEH